VDNDSYCLALKTGFASEYAFLIKAQHFHWNVEGRLFYNDHLLFERIYTEVGDAIDDFAENLRKSQCYVPASLGLLAQYSQVADVDEVPSPAAMLQLLLDDSDGLAALFAVLFELAEENGDHGLSNFFADRQDAHKKHSWMLRSSLKQL